MGLASTYRDYSEAKVYTIWVHGPLGAEKGWFWTVLEPFYRRICGLERLLSGALAIVPIPKLGWAFHPDTMQIYATPEALLGLLPGAFRPERSAFHGFRLYDIRPYTGCRGWGLGL